MSENCLNVYAVELKLILSCILLTKHLKIGIVIVDFLLTLRDFDKFVINEKNFNGNFLLQLYA